MPKATNTKAAEAAIPVSIEPGSINPMIGFHWSDTVRNVECAASYLARMHRCIADIDERNPAFLDADTYREKRGLALVLECISYACRHVIEKQEQKEVSHERP